MLRQLLWLLSRRALYYHVMFQISSPLTRRWEPARW